MYRLIFSFYIVRKSKQNGYLFYFSIDCVQQDGMPYYFRRVAKESVSMEPL